METRIRPVTQNLYTNQLFSGKSEDVEEQHSTKEMSTEDILEDIESKIIPVSIVLMPVAQGMLIMGSHMKNDDCRFKLPEYLVIAGAVSLTLGIMGVISKQILGYILSQAIPDEPLPQPSKNVLNILKLISRLLMCAQIAILVAGVAIIIPNLKDWDAHDINAVSYCEYGPVVFTCIYLSITWMFIFFAVASIIYIKLGSYSSN